MNDVGKVEEMFFTLVIRQTIIPRTINPKTMLRNQKTTEREITEG